MQLTERQKLRFEAMTQSLNGWRGFIYGIPYRGYPTHISKVSTAISSACQLKNITDPLVVCYAISWLEGTEEDVEIIVTN